MATRKDIQNRTMKKNYQIFMQSHWWDRKYDGRRKDFKGITRSEFAMAKEKAIQRRYYSTRYYEKSLLRRCYESVVEWGRPENLNYQKVVMYGHTYLYLCSPLFGHTDYNKSRLMPIKGNERECEFLMKVSNRVANKSHVMI